MRDALEPPLTIASIRQAARFGWRLDQLRQVLAPMAVFAALLALVAIAVALVGEPDRRWSLDAVARALPWPRPDVARVVQSMRFAGRLGMQGWALSPTICASFDRCAPTRSITIPP